MAKVLVVEDDETLLQTLRYNLSRDGHDVRLCTDGAKALELARAEPRGAMILDIMLAGMDGLEVCRLLRRDAGNRPSGAIPILMLTARDDEIDKVVGLEVGADDYLTKPFSMRELIARIKALLRRRDLIKAELERQENAAAGERLGAGDLEIDLARHRVTKAGRPVTLTPREFDLLVYLMRHRGHVLSAERLLEQVWGYDQAIDTRTVAVHIRSLREKLEEQPSQPRRIETLRGVGYRFTG